MKYAVEYWTEHTRNCASLSIQLFPSESSQLRTWNDKFENIIKKWQSLYSSCVKSWPWQPKNFLHLACWHGFAPWVLEILKQVTSSQPEPSRISSEELLHAIRQSLQGGLEVEFLVAGRHWSTNFVKDCCITALHCAVMNSHESIVCILLDHQACIEARDYLNRTSLFDAVRSRNESMTRLLIGRGANVKATTGNGWILLPLTDETEVMVDILSTEPELRCWSVMHEAAEGGDKNIMKMLIDHGGDPNAQSSEKWTVLHAAVANGHEEVVCLLLASGAGSQAKGWDGATPLHVASQHGLARIARLLTDYGADTRATRDSGISVLHDAVKGESRYDDVRLNPSDDDRKATVELLLDRKANAHAKMRNGKSILHQAAQTGNENMIELLLGQGADVQAKDNMRRTIFHYAAQQIEQEASNLRFLL